MNRLILSVSAPMSDCPVLWRELAPLFKRIYPRTIQDAIDNDRRARVNFCGTPFDIIPETVPGFESDFAVWGPPHVNVFPDSV